MNERFLQLSASLSDYHQPWPNKRKLSTTLKKKLSRLKFNESAQESMKVFESSVEFHAKWKQEFKLLATEDFSFLFGPGFTY